MKKLILTLLLMVIPGIAIGQVSMRDYPLNNAPATNDDTLLGIDNYVDPGNWTVNNFSMSGLLSWVNANATFGDLNGPGAIGEARRVPVFTDTGGKDLVDTPVKIDVSGNVTGSQIVEVSADPYGAGWASKNEAAGKADVRNAIESIPGGGDVTGPASSVANEVAVFGDTTGKTIVTTPVQIDPVTGAMSGVDSIESVAKPNPGVTFKDSDMPGVSKEIGGSAGQYISGAEGAENSYNTLTALINGALSETGTIYNGAVLADGEFKGDFIVGYNCGATINKGQIVTLQNSETNPWVLADADDGTKAHGIAMFNCTTGNPTAVMIKGQYRDDTSYAAINVGTEMFMGNAQGSVTITKPTGSGDTIQIVGHRYPNNTVMFDFGRSTSRVQ